MPAIRCARCGKEIEVQNFRVIAVCPHCGFPPDLECYGFQSQVAKPGEQKPAYKWWQFNPNPPNLDSAERYFPGAVRALLIFAKLSTALMLVAINYAIAAHVASQGHPLKTLLVRISLGLSTLLFIASIAFMNKLTFSGDSFGLGLPADWRLGYRGPHRRLITVLGLCAIVLQFVGLDIFLLSCR